VACETQVDVADPTEEINRVTAGVGGGGRCGSWGSEVEVCGSRRGRNVVDDGVMWITKVNQVTSRPLRQKGGRLAEGAGKYGLMDSNKS
jgi:hypothetical protein